MAKIMEIYLKLIIMDAVISAIYELDPDKKNEEYAAKAVTAIREQWRNYADPVLVKENKQYLLSQNSLDKIKDQYEDEDFKKNITFRNMGLLSSTLDTIIEELAKNPPKAEVKALDPTAMSERKRDLDMLKNRHIIEQDLSALQSQIGLPAYKFKNKNAKSNVDEFDEMGLDQRDPDDINFFKDYHRLFVEIALQGLVNAVMLTNRFNQEILRKLILDMLAIRRISLQVFVDKITGEIKYRYIYPETAKHIEGVTYDGRDDIAKGWEDNITLSEWLQLVPDFDYAKDWKMLLNSINGLSSQKYTGFERSGVILRCVGTDELKQINADGVGGERILNWNTALRFKVYAGYVEWKSPTATSTLLKRKADDSFVDVVPYAEHTNPVREITEYYTEPSYQEQSYGAYFLASGSTSQSIYNFSKTYYTQFEGANDEYASGTLIFYREAGTSAVDMVKSDIDMIHEAYYKMRFLVYKSKPEDDVYIWEEQIAKSKLFKQVLDGGKTGTGKSLTIDGIISQVIAFERAKTIKIRAYPEIDGKKVTQLPSLEGKQNGVDPLAGMMQAMVEWGEGRLKRKILGNGLRLGDNPQAREALKSEQNSVDASKNSTAYIERSIQFLKEKAATVTTLYAQDIIKFEDSLPFKYLKNLLGENNFNGLFQLKDVAAHRFGIFIRDYNIEIAKADLRQAAQISLQEKLISYDDYFIITQTEDYKEASRKYSLIRYQNEKKIRNQQVQDQKIAQQTQAQEFQQKMALLQFERETIILKQQEENKATILGKQIDAKSKTDVKDMTIKSEPSKQQAKAAADESLEYTKANIEQSKPYGV